MNKKRLTKLLKDLIKIPSLSGQENDAMIYCKDFINDNIGVNPLFDESFKRVKEEGKEKKYSNIELWFGNKPKLIFNGHIDVVGPMEEKWTITKPFEPKITDNKLYGRGAVDTKGSTCAAIEAITSLVEQGNEIEGLLLILESDEESGSLGAERFINKYKNKLNPELLVFTEPTDNKISNEQKGIYQAKISTKAAKGEHSHACFAQLWGEGKLVVSYENAIDKMVPVLNRLKKFKNKILKLKPNKAQDGVTFNFGIIKGGTATNIIPLDCYVNVDSRIPTDRKAKEIANQLKEYMEAKNKNGKKYCECNIESKFMREAIITPKDKPNFLKFVDCVNQVFGKAEYLLEQGYTELEMYSRDLNPGKELLAISFGAGPMEKCHVPDEYVNLDMLFNAEKVYEKAIKKFCVNK